MLQAVGRRVGVGRDDDVVATPKVLDPCSSPIRTPSLAESPGHAAARLAAAPAGRTPPGIPGNFGPTAMHTSSTLVLVIAVFGASLVEMVEALTIVVAAGVSRGWRSALEGGRGRRPGPRRARGAVGVPLVRYVPIDTLRVVVGALLLVLGLAWLRKAILALSGHKALHDEDEIYAETVAELGDGSANAARRGYDGVGFAVAFKGVFLEGTEVVLIVISLGAAQHRLGLAAAGRGRGARAGRRRRPGRRPPAQRGAREHHQDGGRRHALQLRALLDR